MAHMIEKTEDGYSMAYTGEVPWHGLGKKVGDNLSSNEMLKAANLDWEVEKAPAFATFKGKKFNVGRDALIRTSDGKLLDVVTSDWKPVQNAVAAEFFDDFVKVGDMTMETAGALRGGQIVWMLAKTKDSFEVFKGDKVDSYLLFTNPHKYGWATDIRFTPIRVVCNNTLTLSLAGKQDKVVRVSHRLDLDLDEVKSTLGIAREKLAKYKEYAVFLGSKRAKEKPLMDYFREIFKNTSKDADAKNELSRPARMALSIVDKQPGAEFAKGSWWQAFNSATFMVDHVIGRNNDNRVSSAWYGGGRKLKNKALEKALEYANAA